METTASYTNDTMFFSSDERKWINRIRRIAEQHPDEVTILAQPEDNDGCIYAKMPRTYMKIQPKLRRELSDEEKSILADRLAKSREKRPE